MPRLRVLENRTVPSTFTVVNTLDSGPGSLRQAILDANSTPGDDIIPFEVTGTINLAGPLPDLGSNIDIQGPGANLLTVRDPVGSYRIFTVGSGATVTLSGLTITGGYTSGEDGGGILNYGTLTLNDATVSGNEVFEGSGGGGIANGGTLTLNNATVSGNEVFTGSGGGILNIRGGTLTLNNSTVSGNSSMDTGSGGGIGNAGTLTLNNSTVSGNQAFGFISIGGGIRNSGTLTARNTILAGNRARSGPDLDGGLGSLGHNLIGNTSGGSGFHPTDLLDVNPLLGPLADNGGPTLTHALLPGSPALDAGDNADAPEADQRGFSRVVGGAIDMGAVEVQVGPVAFYLLWPFVATVPADVPVDLYVVALDAYGHVVTDFEGMVYLVSTDPAVEPVLFTFRPEDGGVAHLEDAVTFHTPGPQLLLAIDATFTAIGLGLYEVG